jgi:glycosyltransferase involved in cell wall biosynthesis
VVYVNNLAGVPQAVVLVVTRAGLPMVCRFSELWFAANFLAGDRFLRHLGDGAPGAHRALGWAMRLVNRLPGLRFDLRRPVAVAVSWNSLALREAAGPVPTITVTDEAVIHPATPRHARYAGLQRRPSPEPVIAYVGRVTTAKGAEVACRALAVLAERHGQRPRLVYAGSCAPALRGELEELATGLGVADRVELRGALDADALGALLSEAHAMLMPTISHEAYGLAGVEAALARVPVVASDLGGIPEALPRDGVWLFPPGDADALAAAVAAVLADPAAAAARAARAHAAALTQTVEEYVAASEAFVARVAAAGSR